MQRVTTISLNRNAYQLEADAHARLEDGNAAMQRGDYENALRELRPLAEEGVAEAQQGLGILAGQLMRHVGLTPQFHGQGIDQRPARIREGQVLNAQGRHRGAQSE